MRAKKTQQNKITFNDHVDDQLTWNRPLNVFIVCSHHYVHGKRLPRLLRVAIPNDSNNNLTSNDVEAAVDVASKYLKRKNDDCLMMKLVCALRTFMAVKSNDRPWIEINWDEMKREEKDINLI